MNTIFLLASILITAGIVCSAELWRRGVYADDEEIADMAQNGDNGGKLLIIMILSAIGGYILMQIG